VLQVHRHRGINPGSGRRHVRNRKDARKSIEVVGQPGTDVVWSSARQGERQLRKR